jgi:hypothetical protein
VSKTAGTIISTSIVWIILIVLAISVWPAFSVPSTIVRVNVENTTQVTMRVAFFVSGGTTVGSAVSAGELTECILFEGELSNPKAPQSVHIVVVDEDTDLVLNKEFGISRSQNGFALYPSSLVIKDPKEGEIEAQVEVTMSDGVTQ